MTRFTHFCTTFLVVLALPLSADYEAKPQLQRVTTVVPFPRGIQPLGEDFVVLSRGRVRGSGGVSAEIEDRAGTLFLVNPDVRQSVLEPEVSEEVRENGRVLAEPTSPPFRLWNRSSVPPSADRETDRPYCVLRYHEASKNLFICAFSGVDKPGSTNGRSFSKNLTDAILRFDLRSNEWHTVERHDIEAGGLYPHHNPKLMAPPHGWLNGPNNLLVQGDWLYAVGKDNSLLVRYDLRPLLTDSTAPALPSEWVLGGTLALTNGSSQTLEGHSALAWHKGFCYLGTRTNSVIVRFPMSDTGEIEQPLKGELIALFDPFDPNTNKTSDITDITFDPQGQLYVLNAQPSRVFRFVPDPITIFDARNKAQQPWFHLADALGNPKMKSENIHYRHPQQLFVTSGDGYGYQSGADGTLYVITW